MCVCVEQKKVKFSKGPLSVNYMIMKNDVCACSNFVRKNNNTMYINEHALELDFAHVFHGIVSFLPVGSMFDVQKSIKIIHELVRRRTHTRMVGRFCGQSSDK